MDTPQRIFFNVSYTRTQMCFAAVGSFEPRKNYGFLLDVFEELWAEGHGFRLVVIGRQNAESRALIDRFRRRREIGNRLMCVFDAPEEVGRKAPFTWHDSAAQLLARGQIALDQN
jgi:hypothetical protein